jgi:hypothetical protein
MDQPAEIGLGANREMVGQDNSQPIGAIGRGDDNQNGGYEDY